MAFPAIAAANDFIRLAKGKGLSPMKLQKLVYYAHGWHLALHDSPLIEENVEAWQFGPVIPVLYHAFKRYGDSDITRTATELDHRPLTSAELSVLDEQDRKSRLAFDVIKSVWSAYKDFSATRLSNATHQQGTPWSQTYRPGSWSTVIPDELIRSYFKAL